MTWTYRYRLLQRLKDGSLWRSSEVFEGDSRQLRQNVIAGFLSGEPRWAESEDNPGFFLFGLDRRGNAHETGTGSEDFSS